MAGMVIISSLVPRNVNSLQLCLYEDLHATEVLFSCKKSSTNHPQIMFYGTVVTKMKLKEFNTNQQLLSPVHGKVHVAQSSMRN